MSEHKYADDDIRMPHRWHEQKQADYEKGSNVAVIRERMEVTWTVEEERTIPSKQPQQLGKEDRSMALKAMKKVGEQDEDESLHMHVPEMMAQRQQQASSRRSSIDSTADLDPPFLALDSALHGVVGLGEHLYLAPHVSTTSDRGAPMNAVTSQRAPRRLSMSDADAIARALERAKTGPISRPSTAERRATRTFIQVTQQQRGRPELGDSEVFCAIYTPDSTNLVGACGDGTIRLYNAMTRRLMDVGRCSKYVDHMPITSIQLRPNPNAAEEDQPPFVFWASSAGGVMSEWEVDEHDELHEIRSFQPSTETIYSVDCQSGGSQFVTGGRDRIVRLYDESHLTLLQSLGGSYPLDGHSNRVFCVRFHPTSPSVVVSGGWDNTIRVWDTRSGRNERTMFGPHICGESISIRGDGKVLLTGSWREQDALQRWDMSTGKLIDVIPWNSEEEDDNREAQAPLADSSMKSLPCMIYSARYSPDDRLIAAGGGGNGCHQCKIFDAETGRVMERVTLHSSLYTTAFTKDGRKLAMAGVDPHMTILNLS